jgi:hypothetical protein
MVRALEKDVDYLKTRNHINEAQLDGTYKQDKEACQKYATLVNKRFVNISYSGNKRSPDCQIILGHEINEVDMGQVYEFLAKNNKTKVCPCPADK